MVLSFPVMADYAWFETNGLRIFATHGHLHGEQNPPPLSDNDILLCGHTHVPAWNRHDGYLYLNPGSVSIPKEGSQRGYIILEDKTFIWKNLSGEEYHRLTISNED
jgi:putative phosphoesterase